MSPAPKVIDPVASRSGTAVPHAPQVTAPLASRAAPAIDAATRNRLIVSTIVFVALVGAMTYLFFGEALSEALGLPSARSSAASVDGTGLFPVDLPPTGAGPRRAVPGRSTPTEGATRAADDALAAAERALAAQQGALPSATAERPAAASKDRRVSGVVTPPPTSPTFTEADRGATRGAPRSADAARTSSTPKPASIETTRLPAEPAGPCTPNVAALGLCTAPTIQPKE